VEIENACTTSFVEAIRRGKSVSRDYADCEEEVAETVSSTARVPEQSFILEEVTRVEAGGSEFVLPPRWR